MSSGVVPELLVKKRRRDEQWAAERAAAAVEGRKHAKASRKEMFKRAEQYVKEYRQQASAGAGARMSSQRKEGRRERTGHQFAWGVV
jgi:large subunit ribosomal protein L7e